MDYIVILDRTSTNPQAVRYVLRALVPTGRQSYFADAAKTSAFPGISAGDLADLRAGKFVERVGTFEIGSLPLNSVAVALQGMQQEFQARVTEDGAHNPWRYYGTTWDGTSWTMRGTV